MQQERESTPKQEEKLTPGGPLQFNVEFWRKPSTVLIYLIVLVVSVLVVVLDLPYDLMYVAAIVGMISIGIAYARFVRSKQIKATRTEEGMVYEMGGQKWVEPRAYFIRVALLLLILSLLIGIVLVVTRNTGLAQFLLALLALLWALAIRRGIRKV